MKKIEENRLELEKELDVKYKNKYANNNQKISDLEQSLKEKDVY
jgi:hypothetical protein